MKAEQGRPLEGELLFVYAADSGLFNTLADIGHKIFSPQTYPCQLCALTHGYFAERTEWRTFIEGLGRPVRFLHRDELPVTGGVTGSELPAFFEWHGGEWVCRLGAEDMAACKDLSALQGAIVAALS